MAGCNPSLTPIEPRQHLIKNSPGTLVDATKYQSVINALWNLVHTRPDLAHSVSYTSQFMVEPDDDHLEEVKRIL
jgi:hypothetical protein